MKTDQNGFHYYDKLPEGFRLAKLNDFHVNGKKNIGMEYLIQRGSDPDHYEVHQVTEHTTALALKSFIDCEMVYVKQQAI